MNITKRRNRRERQAEQRAVECMTHVILCWTCGTRCTGEYQSVDDLGTWIDVCVSCYRRAFRETP